MQRKLIVAIVAAGVVGGIVAGLTVLAVPAMKAEWDRYREEEAKAQALRVAINRAWEKWPRLALADRQDLRWAVGTSDVPLDATEPGQDDLKLPQGTTVSVIADDGPSESEANLWGMEASMVGWRRVVVEVPGREGRWGVHRRCLVPVGQEWAP